MLRLTEDLRYYFYTGKVSLRRGCASLCGVITTEMSSDPRDERNCYIFMNASRTILRMIRYERGFFIMYEKRPSTGHFRKPVYDARTGRLRIPYSDLVCLSEGLVRTDIRLSESSLDTQKK